MSLIGKLLGLLGAAFVYTCVAVTVAQAVGVRSCGPSDPFRKTKPRNTPLSSTALT